MQSDRRIISDAYCGRCGYNLRTLPYIYSCPECGNPYNARPLTLRGIFVPFDDWFRPLGCFLLVPLLIAFAIPLIVGGLASEDGFYLLVGVFAGIGAVGYLLRGIDLTRRCMLSWAISRRIAADEAAAD